MNLQELLREDVFRFFGELSRIPRCSHHEEAVAGYLEAFAAERNLPCRRDSSNNLVIRRPMEGRGWVALQAHIDMVCITREGSTHDFSRDPVRLVLQGDQLYADGTTLGADNGIGAALMLALLDDPDYHGPGLECLFTSNEEDGMTGASALDLTDLRADRLINLDAEEEGRIHISCAGGVIARLTLPLEIRLREGTAYRIEIAGLLGGHSGLEIHKGLANANRLLGRILTLLREEDFSFRISSLEGGSKINAIPTWGRLTVMLRKREQLPRFLDFMARIEKLFGLEYRDTDPEIRLKLIKMDGEVHRVFSKDCTTAVIGLLTLIPDGVLAMSQELEGLVETSNNLGVVAREDGALVFSSLLRSSRPDALEDLRNRFTLLKSAFGVELLFEHPYPAWPIRKDSPLRRAAHQAYRETFGKEASDLAIHAGLECGIFLEKKPMLDIVSIGPDTDMIHTAEEHVSVPSVLRLRTYLVRLLAALG